MNEKERGEARTKGRTHGAIGRVPRHERSNLPVLTYANTPFPP